MRLDNIGELSFGLIVIGEDACHVILNVGG